MQKVLAAADEMYNAALQILNGHGVDAKAVPLVMCTVAQRLDAFALGAMAHELSTLEGLKKEREQEEVDDGGHIARD